MSFVEPIDPAGKRPGALALDGPGVWQGGALQQEDWQLALPAACCAELVRVADLLKAHPLPLTLLDPADYELDECRQFMAQVKHMLAFGSGLALVRDLPLQQLDESAAKQVYWLLSCLIERPVAQSFDAQLLYDVIDTGQRIDTRVRGDVTRQELSWHTDYGFNHPPPYIGLLVLQTGRCGGVSRVASLLHAHNEMIARHPQLLERLYRPFCWNRQGEHPEGAALVHSFPIFDRADGQVRGRFIKWLLYRGYELAGEIFDEQGKLALETLFEIMSETRNHLCFELQAGQIQYMNNYRVAHCRTEYEDFDEVQRKRHLVRIFLRDSGRRSYMG
ncbi:MAG: hypothetical protein ACI8W7_001515 [Gammaproteobacteria bacterium]|jgi:hypothetical protein